MKNIIKGNTDFIIVVLTSASVVLTIMKIMDVKDFGTLVAMAFSFKFGQGQKPALPVTDATLVTTVPVVSA